MPSYRVRLEICGSSYVVSTSDEESYLRGLAERLDRDMNEMMAATPNASVTAAAVVTALGYLDEADKAAQAADNMRAQIQGYLEDASKARMAAEESRREADRLRRELSKLQPREGAKPVPPAPKPQAGEPLLNLGPASRPQRRPEEPIERLPGQLDLDDL